MNYEPLYERGTAHYWQDRISDALQDDLEHGVKALNQNAAERFNITYPALVKVLGELTDFTIDHPEPIKDSTELVVLLAELLGRFHEFQFDAGGYCEWCGCTTNWKHNDDCVYPEVTAALAAAKGEKHE